MAELVKKLTYDVGWLGKTIKGKFNTEYIIIQGGGLHRVSEHQSFTLGRGQNIEIFEVDMTIHPVKLNGRPESRDAALFFNIEVELGVAVQNASQIIRVNEPVQMLAKQAGALAREIASKYAIMDYMQTQTAIHHALTRHDFSVTGLQVRHATVKIELGPKERAHIDDKKNLERSGEIQQSTAKQNAELDKLRLKYEAEIAAMRQKMEADLEHDRFHRDLELRKKEVEWLEQLMTKGEVGIMAAKMLDENYSMHDLVDQMLKRRDMNEAQKLKLLQQLMENKMLEAHTAQPLIATLLESISTSQFGASTLPALASSNPAGTSSLPSNVPSPQAEENTANFYSINDDASTDSDDNSFQIDFRDDDDFEDKPAGPSIISGGN